MLWKNWYCIYVFIYLLILFLLCDINKWIYILFIVYVINVCNIAPRSGLAYKNFIDIGAGVIDGDYRGPVGVVMFNHDKQDFKVTKGMRVAQLILERYVHDAEIKCVDELSDTVRGDGGFGSTGLTDDNKDSKQN